MINHVDNPIKSPAVLSVCTGIRGLERGVERVIGPCRTVAYVEIEAFIVANLLAGMEAGILAPAPIWSNLKTFPWQFFRGKVDLLMGGYPCQPFSNAGKGLAAADPRHLWPYIESGIRTIRPLCCFFENVAAHLNKGYREVKRSLEEMGYVVKEGIYAAEEVGAPHRRERLFILAILGNASRQRCETILSCSVDERRSSEKERIRSSAEFPGSEELADANGDGSGTNTRDSAQQSGTPKIEAQRQERDVLFGQWSGGNIGHGDSARLPSTSWPARPGEFQHWWEAPRLISLEDESGMGCTTNGYNFREDILRALGNGVVEQQSEYAFRDLIGKHFKSLS